MYVPIPSPAAWKHVVDSSGIINILLPNNTAKTEWNSRAGIALTFDDRSVDQWYEIRDLLKKYNAHATFFVTLCGGDLDQDQINKLRELAADGNEIGFHGTNHIDAALYLQNHSIQDYLDYEIHPGLNQMTNAGFDVVDFAYPSGSDDKNLNVELQKYFLHIRGTAYSDIDDPLKDVDGVYYHYGSHQKIIHGIGIDDNSYGNSLNDIYHGIARAKKENTILIFYAHMPVKNITGDYQISYNRLEKILMNTSENNLTFYKISEIN